MDRIPTGNDDSLVFDHVSFRYGPGGPSVLTDLSFTAKGGDLIWIVGDNGSGKTTIAKLMCGLVSPVAGEVLIGRRKPSRMRPRVRVQRSFMVQQRSFLGFTKPTILEEVQSASRQSRTLDYPRTSDLIADFIGDIHPKTNPLDLSVSEAWRVALGLGLLINSDVLFVDEIPNLCGDRILNAVRRVITTRAAINKVTIFASHLAPPLDIKPMQTFLLSHGKLQTK